MSKNKTTGIFSVSKTKQSKIVQYGVERECIELRQKGYSLQQIADELNKSGKIPEDDPLDKYVVLRYLEKVPVIENQLTTEGAKKYMQLVTDEFDIIFETTNLFNKTKRLLEAMEDEAIAKNKIMNPYQFKAVASEMRELLTQMANIQKEVNDYNNVRKFMEIVIQVLQEEAPDKIPIIVDKLKMVKDTQWFAEIMNRGGKNDK